MGVCVSADDCNKSTGVVVLVLAAFRCRQNVLGGMRMDKVQKDLAKVIENYFGADAGYLDIDCFTLASRIMEAGWTKPVRCKDCEYCKDNKVCIRKVKSGNRHSIDRVHGNFYCASGKRRGEE